MHLSWLLQQSSLELLFFEKQSCIHFCAEIYRFKMTEKCGILNQFQNSLHPKELLKSKLMKKKALTVLSYCKKTDTHTVHSDPALKSTMNMILFIAIV